MVEIRKIREKDYDVLEVKGEVDASSSIELDNAIQEAVNESDKDLLIDCTSLEYISSAGLGVFMSYLEDFKKKGNKIIFFGLSKEVYNVFEILGLNQLLNIQKDREQAKLALNEV